MTYEIKLSFTVWTKIILIRLCHLKICQLASNFFVCLLSFLSHSRIFHSYGDISIAGEGLQILTYARHSWPLSSEGSLACHTYCDMGHLFIMVIFEDLWHSHLLMSVWQRSGHYLFLQLRSVATGDQTPISHTQGEHSTSMPQRQSLTFLTAHVKGILKK